VSAQKSESDHSGAIDEEQMKLKNHLKAEGTAFEINFFAIK